MKTVKVVQKRSGKIEEYSREKVKRVFMKALENVNVKLSKDEINKILDELELQIHDGISTERIQELLIRITAEKTSAHNPHHLKIAGSLLLHDIYKKRAHNLGIKYTNNPYSSDTFIKLIKLGVKEGIYEEDLITKYTEDEIKEFGEYIKQNQKRDYLFTYTGLKVLSDRYLQRIHDKLIELPQEMYMLVAMTIHKNEENPTTRFKNVIELYDELSTHRISLATPILMNARTKRQNYTSCFVLSMEDDLRSINETLYTAGMISKLAGGLGLYIGKLRAKSSQIQNFSNVASGVIPVVKLFNDMMVYVNQLGIRKGSISITLDIWHKDIKDFLEIKTNAGDERQKAHDVHPAISIPDIFMRRLKERKQWSLFDPYMARTYISRKLYSNDYMSAINLAIERFTKSKVKLLNVSFEKYSTNSYSDAPFAFKITYEFKLMNVNDETEKLILPYSALGYDDIIHAELENEITKALGDVDKRLISRQVSKLSDVAYDKDTKTMKISILSLGIGLEDFWGDEFEKWYEELEAVLEHEKIDVFELWKRILTVAFETGEPYIFFRDTANRYNPNKHLGPVYSSNLCMEIVQSMSPLLVIGEHSSSCMLNDIHNGFTDAVKFIHAGFIPTCNLGAINLGKIDVHDIDDIYRSASILVKALDSIIDIIKYPVSYPIKTQQLIRPLGIGVMNYHYLLVKEGIKWESEDHVRFSDWLFERIAYCVLKASNELSMEKEPYPMFEGSSWSKGFLFGRTISEIEKDSEKNENRLPWRELAENIKRYGLRNGYLLALMPTGSTSLIVGATPSIDPIFDKFYKEENMSGILPQVPPEIDKYFWHYKSAYTINHEWTIKSASARQKWIDQAQSLNLFIDPNQIDGHQLSRLYELAWELGLKTVYYLRSKSIVDIDECESCSV